MSGLGNGFLLFAEASSFREPRGSVEFLYRTAWREAPRRRRPALPEEKRPRPKKSIKPSAASRAAVLLAAASGIAADPPEWAAQMSGLSQSV
jgi:hypothetical protein